MSYSGRVDEAKRNWVIIICTKSALLTGFRERKNDDPVSQRPQFILPSYSKREKDVAYSKRAWCFNANHALAKFYMNEDLFRRS